jgi:hypothetical protein
VSNEPEQPVTTEDPTAVTDSGRVRRPSSLRSAEGAAVAAGVASESASASNSDSVSGADSAVVSGADGASGTGLRSKLTPASFPRGKLTAAPFPRGKLTAAPFPRRGPRTGVEPLSTTDPAAQPQEAGPSPSEKLITLISERPEVGLGIAFAVGLVIATILKRLAR